jgi:sulfur-carrier protein adenylyltransferase/sulfurtransferase
VTDRPQFTEKQVLRYSRHIILPQIGAVGQRKLLDAKILCIGAGGLGSPAAMYLAAAGVGTLGILDFDRVDLTNLQRQLLHDDDDVGRPKVDSAAERINGINPDVNVIKHNTILTSDNAFDILGSYDVIVDGTDNFPVRYLVNDATQMLGKPLVYGSIFQFDGQASVFLPGRETPCYRCLFPQPPPAGAVPSCSEAGVFGVLPGIVGSIQAVEAIKLVTGIGEPLVGRLLLFDALAMEFTTVNLRWDPDCPVCGKHPTITELIDYDAFCGILAGAVPQEAEHGVRTSVGRGGLSS